MDRLPDESYDRKRNTTAEPCCSEASSHHQDSRYLGSGTCSCYGTLGSDLNAAANRTQSVENVWPEKVDYSLSTPTKAVIFGTNVQVDFKLIPLLKGLKFGKVTTELNEKQEMSIRTQRAPIKSRQTSRSIAKDEYRLPENAESEDIEGQEGYSFSRAISIPQSLRKCLQTVDALGIKVRHNLSFNVQMHNPDGHVSEVSVNIVNY